MEFLKLYTKEYQELLFSMSWLNKNSSFDKSIGAFEKTDLFTFLENVNRFDADNDVMYDDVHYIVEYAQASILHLTNNINKTIKREHRIVPLSQAREFDKKCIIWLSRQDGHSIKEKLRNNKIKTVKRFYNVDTYENRIFKIFLKKMVLIDEVRNESQTEESYLTKKIRQWLRTDEAKSINEYGKIVYNNLLLHHPHYSKIFKSYKWVNKLEQKVITYQENYPKQIATILDITVLAKLQFKTKELVLPEILKIDYDNFKLDFKSFLISEQNNIPSILKSYVGNQSSLLFHTSNIKNLADIIIDKLHIKANLNREFTLCNKANSPVYMDIFRLYPTVRINEETTCFPITLKQKIGNEFVNASNTKVINLEHKIYTLPELLKNKDKAVLSSFVNDLYGQLNTKSLNYVIPDYVNIFEFSGVKQTISNYFPENRNIPKSVLVGLRYLFDNKLVENDTLIFTQKDGNNDVFITPLLVKYDKELKSVTNGLYLERHPTQKLENDSSLIKELNTNFDNEISSNLLTLFLEDGIENISNEGVVFLDNNKQVQLKKTKKQHNKNRIQQVKKLFINSKLLFKHKTIELEESRDNDLQSFEELLSFEKKGYTLWKEHLPKLAMQVAVNGMYTDFVLVNDNSKVYGNTIEIKNHFSIPMDTNELSFPLILGEEQINFEAYISSNDLPTNKDIECKLDLSYDYEAETPYNLVFKALDNSIKPLKVIWREIKEKAIEDLPVPDFPKSKKWSDFKRSPKKEAKGTRDLLDWSTKKLDKLNQPNLHQGYFLRKNQDKNSNYFCFVRVNGYDVFCHSSKFVNKDDIVSLSRGDIVHLTIKENRKKDGYEGENISVTSSNESLNHSFKDLKKEIFTLRFPVLTIWNNGHSLSDINVPDNFRNSMLIGIENAVELIKSDIPKETKDELFFFLSCLHKDTPLYVIQRLNSQLSNIKSLNNYNYRNIAFSIGTAELDWQTNILKKVISLVNNYPVCLQILSIALWRSENLIDKLSKGQLEIIINHLYNKLNKISIELQNKKKANKYFIVEITRLLELLLAILRVRGLEDLNKKQILSPNNKITKDYVVLLDEITKKLIAKNIDLEPRVTLEFEKPKNFSKTTDLLYALRVYLTGNHGAANSIKVLGVKDD